MTDTRTPNDNRSEIVRSVIALVGLSLLLALGMVVGLLLVKHPEWLPPPVAHFLGLGDVYPTQGLIGPQKTIRDVQRARNSGVNERTDIAR